MNRFERILSGNHLPYHLTVAYEEAQAEYNTCVVGEPGVRDTLHPCEFFQYGPATGGCDSDGHYMCKECKYLNPIKLATDLTYR